MVNLYVRQRACKPGSVLRRSLRAGGCAAIPLGDGLPRPSSNQPGRRAGTRLMWHPYSVLHPVGFTVPALLPAPRCALAAPFRPYPSPGMTLKAGGILSVALSLTRFRPRVRANRRALPGTVVPWSPDFPRESKLPRGRPALWQTAYKGTRLPLRVGYPKWVESGRQDADLLRCRRTKNARSTDAAAMRIQARSSGSGRKLPNSHSYGTNNPRRAPTPTATAGRTLL